jgi:sulfur relay protein TusB/DsrH
VASILLVLTSSPASPRGARALALAETLAEEGHAVTLCGLQDAVILGTDHAPPAARAALARLVRRGARLSVLEEDLRARGLTRGAATSAVDHAGVVSLLATTHDRVIGTL